jgi:hypothetical protein
MSLHFTFPFVPFVNYLYNTEISDYILMHRAFDSLTVRLPVLDCHLAKK